MTAEEKQIEAVQQAEYEKEALTHLLEKKRMPQTYLSSMLEKGNTLMDMTDLADSQKPDENGKYYWEYFDSYIPRAKAASEFGDICTEFIWKPYLPVGEYVVLMGDSGTGKTYFACGVAADLSQGRALPDAEPQPPMKTLIISAEDSGELLKHRLQQCNANIDNICMLDVNASAGMSISEHIEEFEAEIKAAQAALVIIDPIQAFIGSDIDMNRVNQVRPAMQKLATAAKNCHCCIIVISHVNKKGQGDNANNAALGSSDIINASRSAIKVIFDDDDEDSRIAVHTKANYTAMGKSLTYSLADGAFEWTGLSDVTKRTLEAAARHRCTVAEQRDKDITKEDNLDELIEALKTEAAAQAEDKNKAIAYSFISDKYGGEKIWAGMQPQAALRKAAYLLKPEGINISGIGKGVKLKPDETGKRKTVRGFNLQRVKVDTK